MKQAETTLEQYKQRYKGVTFSKREPILDIGGGNGRFLEFQGIKEALILDATRDINKNYDYLIVDLTKKLPRIGEKFNTIFIMETLEHLPNPLYLLGQVYNLLTKDGVCYISIPYTPISDDSHHVCRWTLFEILDQVIKLGFMPTILQKRRRFKGLGFWLPHCWIVLELRTGNNKPSINNIINNNLDLDGGKKTRILK